MTTAEEKKWVTTEPVHECGFAGCGETFPNNQKKTQHEVAIHPGFVAAPSAKTAKQEEAPTPPAPKGGTGEEDMTTPEFVAGVNMEGVHGFTKSFARALEGTDMSATKKKQLVMAFDEQAGALQSNPSQLERFLNMAGMTTSQAVYIKLLLGGSAENNQQGMQTGMPQQQAYTFNPATGQMQASPIFMMGNGQPQPAGQPPIFFNQPAAGPSPEVAELTRRMDSILEKLSEQKAPAPAPSPIPMRRVRRPMIDASGNPMKDGEGQTIVEVVEEPYQPDSFGDAITKLGQLGLLQNKDAPVPVTAEAMADALSVKLTPLLEKKEDSKELEETRGLREAIERQGDEFREYRHEAEMRENTREAREETAALIEGKLQPIIERYQNELKDTRGREGLSDHQAELRHQQDVFGTAVNSLNSMLSGLRSDLQPLAVSQMVGQMKTMGIGDNQIGEIIRRMPQPGAAPITAEEQDRRAETMSKWMAE